MAPSDSTPPGPPPPAGEPSLEELRALQRLHTDLVNTIDGIVWEADASGTRFLFVSPQAARILGHAPEMWTGAPDFWEQHILPADRAEAMKFRRQASQGQGGRHFEYRMVAADGSTHWMRDIVTVVADEGRPVRLRGIMVDATDRKRAEEALKASENRLLSIFESELECVKVVAADGTVLDMNPAGLAMLEVSRREEAVGQPMSRWVAPEWRDAYRGLEERVFRGESVAGEFEMIGQRGTRRWMETHAVPMRDSQSAITSLIAVTRDVSGRKFAERVREATYAIAEAALSTSELQVLFACVHQIIRGLLPAENFYIALHDPATRMVSFPYFVDQCDPPPAPRIFGRGLTELVIRTGQPQLLSEKDVAPLRASGELEAFGADSLAWLGVPLRGSGGILGALVVQSYGEGHLYTPAERDMLSFVSGQVAMAIERKRAEETLRESEARQRALFETMGEGVVYQDAEGRIILANSAAERILGLSQEQMMGRSSLDPRWASIHPDGTEFPGQEHPAMVALRTGRPVTDVLMGIFHPEEGRHRWAVVNAVPEFRPGEDRPYQVFATITEVTEIKRIQDELRVTEPRLRAVLSNSPAVIYQLDREGRFLLSEGKGLEALGLKPGQVVGQSALEVYRDSAETIAQLQRSLAGDFVRGQLEVQGVVFDSLLAPIRNDQGQVESVIGIATDITERVRAERALRDSEERFRGVFENSTIGIYRTTLAGEVLLANPSLVKMLGFAFTDELLARDLASVGYEPSYPRSQFLEVLGQGLEVRGLESAWTRADGTVLHVRESAHATRDAQGRILYFDGTVEDITERVRAEQALRDSEATYRGLFDAVAEAIYIQDRAGRFLDVNQGAVAMYGFSREELVGQTPELVSAPGANDIPAVMAKVRRAFEGEPQQFEFWGRRASGEVFPKEVKLYPGTYFGQQVVIALAVDISERRRTEEARRQSQKLESLGVLAGGIAHDFNNLLTAILGNLNLAQMRLIHGSPALPHLVNAEKAVQRASELTKQMLAYSGKGRFVVHALDLNSVVQEMVHLLQVSISKKASLRFQLAPCLPAIQADAAQIQQVVMNLVTNASEAIGNAEGVIGVSTRHAELDGAAIAAAFPTQGLEPGSYVVLEVRDTGCGMTPEVQTKIFDPFFTTKITGRGLGLSAMLGILRGHRAGILIRSEPEQGSTFELFFPACNDIPAAREEAGPEHEGLFTGTILLVDDEDGIVESTSATLEGLGFRVVSARDGVQALERFQAEAEQLRVVLMDLTMPRMDGATAFLAMQQSRPEIPVILSSGYDEQEFADALRDRGCAGFLQKPYRFQELRRILRQVLAPSP